MAKRKPNQQSEPITPQEIIANEPEVKETVASLESKEMDKAMEVGSRMNDEVGGVEHFILAKPESTREEIIMAQVEAADTVTGKAIAAMQLLDSPIPAEKSAKEILVKAGIEPTEEEKILSFLEGKTGFVRINELLKSLYGVPSFNVPAQWLQQGESRRLKGVLQRLVDAGKIEVKNNAHQTLGNFYYGEDTKQKHRNLNDTIIEAATKK